MKDFNLHGFLRNNPLTTKKSSKKNINEAFEGFGGVRGIAPIQEAPIQPKDFGTFQDPWGWDDHVKSMKDDEENRPNKWIMDIDRFPNPYKDWSVSWEYPGIIVWAHPDVIDGIVAATPGWDGKGTPIEFQSAAGSSQMLKVLDQDEFPSFNAYVKAVAPYLDMVEDANVNPTGEKTPKGSEEFQGVHEKQDYIVKGDNEVIVRIEDSVETIEGIFDQMIADPRKNIRGLAEYGHQTIQDIKQILKLREGYMGTQYDSSEDMAVDMVKKGIREDDEVNETMTADKGWQYDDDDEFMRNMEDLVNQKHLAKFAEAAMMIAQDLADDGFETIDIKMFLKDKIEGFIMG